MSHFNFFVFKVERTVCGFSTAGKISTPNTHVVQGSTTFGGKKNSEISKKQNLNLPCQQLFRHHLHCIYNYLHCTRYYNPEWFKIYAKVICKHYASLYKGLEHPWILVSARVLQLILHGYWDTDCTYSKAMETRPPRLPSVTRILSNCSNCETEIFILLFFQGKYVAPFPIRKNH